MRPQLIHLKDIDSILHGKNALIIDVYRELLEDLFLIRNPRFKFDKNYIKEFEVFITEHTGGRDMKESGSWFYFPWNNQLVHYLSDSEHQEIRTTRNRNLITNDEQKKLRDARIAVAGMSVGSHCALTLNMMGMSRYIKIADPDTLSASNMNRVRYDFTKVGQKKTSVAREYIYQMDPYGEVEEYAEGVTPENIDKFLKDIDVLVEETDHLETKIFLREEARKRGIPVVMATDNGDGVIVDIERFDLNQETYLFNGLIGDITLEEFKTFPPTELPRLATKIAGAEMVVPRMMSSLGEVGKTLYSWPQLGDAATLSGVVVAFVIKQIILGIPIDSGKIDVSLEKIFHSTHI
ncbi:MAG: ThiF family adenylyltransferase [Candidatus Paceibacterota bacterium]